MTTAIENLGSEFVKLLKTNSRGATALATLRDEDVEIATTPKTEVLRVDKTRLYRYEPLVQQRVSTPLLLTYSQVGRYTMMDLQPDRSLVRNLLEAGIVVYLIDWGEPSRADRWLTFDDYIEEYVAQAVEYMRNQHAVDKVSLMGICEGGIFASCFAALHPDRVRNLVLAVTPIDFHADLTEPDKLEQGYLNRWTRNLSRAQLTDLIDSYGHMPGELSGLLFQAMTPVKSLTKYNWDLPDALAGDRDQVLNFLRMEKWLSDRPHHPGEAAKQWLIDLYLENRLVRDTFEIGGRVVHLRNLTMPVLNVFASKDHIVPPPTSRALRDHVGCNDYQELELKAGHIGTFVSCKANKVLSERLIDWLSARDSAQCRNTKESEHE